MTNVFTIWGRRLSADAPIFTGLTVFVTLTALPLVAAAVLDTREFLGAPVWQKPLQFHLALAVYTLSLAFFARFMPEGMTSRRWRLYAGIVAFSIIAELVWVGGAAAYATASHFNRDNEFLAAIYPVMGLLALILTSISAAVGISIWRNPNTGLAPALHLSVALGLVLTCLLTVIAANLLSAMPGHHVGVPTTGAALPILGWSREVGDLRVAHFFATHALHALPIIGLIVARLLPSGLGKATVWAVAMAFSVLIAATMMQALAGQPFLPWIG